MRAAALLSLLLMADTRSQSVIVVDRPPSIPVPPPPVGPHPPREGPTEDDIRTIERARRRREERKAKRLAAVEAGGERGR